MVPPRPAREHLGPHLGLLVAIATTPRWVGQLGNCRRATTRPRRSTSMVSPAAMRSRYALAPARSWPMPIRVGVGDGGVARKLFNSLSTTTSASWRAKALALGCAILKDNLFTCRRILAAGMADAYSSI